MGFFSNLLKPFHHSSKHQSNPTILPIDPSVINIREPLSQVIIDGQKGRKGGYTTQGPQNLKKNIREPLGFPVLIPSHLHSHPSAPHFDKGEVRPHHRLIRERPSNWMSELKPKQPRMVI